MSHTIFDEVVDIAYNRVLMRACVRFRRLSHGEGLDVPRYESDGAAGMDLRSAVAWFLMPRQIVLMPTGFEIAIPNGFEGQVRPRSGLALKTGVTVLNAPGTIDSDYRGELGVILVNHGSNPIKINRGARIAQLVIAPVARCLVTLVDELDATERGGGGFGSTGI